MGEITALLDRLRGGDAAAEAALYEALYGELKRLARTHLSRAGPITSASSNWRARSTLRWLSCACARAFM